MIIPLEVFPKINASLNALAFCFMWMGYLMIRKKQVRYHVMFMVLALAVSAVFLTCYLYYHFHVGEVTRFKGTGLVRYVYFSILISHTLLAMILPPGLAVVVTKALQKNYEAHKRWVRWFFPMWVYVSFTGVVIFYFLYCLYP